MSQFSRGLDSVLDNVVEKLYWPPKVGDIVTLGFRYVTTSGINLPVGHKVIVTKIEKDHTTTLTSLGNPKLSGKHIYDRCRTNIFLDNNYIRG